MTETAIIDGFTVSGGHADGDGGGMYNCENHPRTVNCILKENSASWYGGGMFNWDSKPTLIGCEFRTNLAEKNGGGMHNYYSSPTLSGCTFSGNWAYWWSGSGIGGGMTVDDNLDSLPVVTEQCTFRDNYAEMAGGGLAVVVGGCTLTDCYFEGNDAHTGNGGGVSLGAGTPQTFTSCIFSGNSAIQGGAIKVTSLASEWANCAFNGNSANSGGAAAINSGTLTNCTLSTTAPLGRLGRRNPRFGAARASANG
ncbi:MAG: right-handed parallel beta-helix repeat-containing protein, partial [Phycisphaerales bacterium]